METQMDVHTSDALDLASLKRLTDATQIPRLLHAALARERAIEAELDAVIAGQSAMQRKMRDMATSTSGALQILAIEAGALEESTAGSADMAERVSAQIRALDLRQARVLSAIEVIDGLVGQSAAVAGLDKAMAREDFEEAARCVDKFLSLEERAAEQAGLDDKAATKETRPLPSAVSPEQTEAFAKQREALESAVESRLKAAAAAGDHAAVARFAALCPLLRRGERGLDTLLRYLSGLISERAAADNEELIASAGDEREPDFVAALTGLFKDVAASIDEHFDLFVQAFGPDLAMTAILTLHAEADVHGTRLLQRYADYRRLPRLVSQVSSFRSNNNGGTQASTQGLYASAASSFSTSRLTSGLHGAISSAALGESAATNIAPVEPRLVESCLEELLGLCGRSEQYLQYVLMRLADVAMLKESSAEDERKVHGRKESMLSSTATQQREASLRGGGFATAVRELLSQYLTLEEYYVDESVSKAIRISSASAGDLTSSVVDDAFYVLSRAGARALSTGRAPAAVAILNALHAVLTTRLCAALEEGLVGAPATLLSARARQQQANSSIDGAWAEDQDPLAVDPVLAQAAVPFNDAEVAAGHAAKLRQRLESIAVSSFASAGDRDRVLLVLGDLSKVAADLRALSAQGVAALASATLGTLRASLDAVAASTELGGNSIGRQAGEASTTLDSSSVSQWAVALADALDDSLIWLRPLLVSSLFEPLALRVLDGVLARVEAAVLAKRFSQLGGLALERDVRFLSGRAAELVQRSVRDKFARLSAVAMLLGLESAKEAADLWGEPGGAGISLRLSEGEVRAVLGQRREWAPEEISRLRLS